MSPSRPRPRSGKRAAEKAAAAPARPPVMHHLVPPHELLSEEETRRILDELGTVPERLPKILFNDPGLTTDPKFRAAKEAKEPIVGRLVRISRPSPTAGVAVAYRLVGERPGE